MDSPRTTFTFDLAKEYYLKINTRVTNFLKKWVEHTKRAPINKMVNLLLFDLTLAWDFKLPPTDQPWCKIESIIKTKFAELTRALDLVKAEDLFRERKLADYEADLIKFRATKLDDMYRRLLGTIPISIHVSDKDVDSEADVNLE